MRPRRKLDDTFFSLTPERVLSSVEVGGRRATGWVLALNSLENRVYEVELEDGQRLVAKFYRPERWPPEAILEEHAFLSELQAEEVPVVPPLDLGGGRTLGVIAQDTDAEGAAGGGIHYAVFPKVRGRPPEELDEGQLRQIGRLLARLHGVGARRRATARPQLTPQTYGAASVRLLLEGDFVPEALRGRYGSVAGRLVEACGRAFAALGPMEAVRLHGDCHLGNLLWGREGPFLLDFDDFLNGPPVQDLWLCAPGLDEEAVRAREALAAGYQELRKLELRTLRLVESLRALRILRYAAWIAQRYGDPAFQRAFPDFREPSYWQRELPALEEQLERVQGGGAN